MDSTVKRKNASKDRKKPGGKPQKPGKRGKGKSEKTDAIKENGKGTENEAGEGDDASFNVEDILYYGGEKDDYKNLLTIDADEEVETTGAGEDEEGILRNEIQNFMQTGMFDVLGQNMSCDQDAGEVKEKSTAKQKKEKRNNAETEKNKKNKNKEAEKNKETKTKEAEKYKKKKTKEAEKNKETKIKKGDKNKETKNKETSNIVSAKDESKTQIEIDINATDSKHEDAVDNPPNESKGKKNNDNKATDSSSFRSFVYKKYDRMLLKTALPWYKFTKDMPKVATSLYENEIDDLFSIAKQYWDTETEIYQQMKEKDRSSDAKWLRTVLTSGTLSDKVAALTMLNQESPIHCMRSLEALMNMSKKKARREALIAIDSLRHLWVADLLPDYKLRKFNEFPLDRLNEFNKSNSKEEIVKLLVSMIFEDNLKKTFSDFVEILQNFSKDPLPDIRTKILGVTYELLQMKPEQEQLLLSILVNKLGDPDRKVASKASFLLCQLVAAHPNMKGVVISEVERMMHRPNMSDKAQYYAICFLNQIVLSHEEESIASKLISIYFSFFKLIVAKDDKKGKKGKKTRGSSSSEHRNKLLGGLLTGVNRAFPYAEDTNKGYDDQLNTLFRLAHVKHFNTSVQAFMLIYQVMQSRQSISDRYYQALYAKLLDTDISTSCKHTMFLNLLYKSLKNDPVLKRVKAFIKRLLQICTQEQPSLLCGVLYLISEVIKTNPAINSMMMQQEDNDDDEEEHFVDAPLDEEITSNKLCSSDDVDCENKETSRSEKGAKESWTFRQQDNKSGGYNINHRNPLYAGAENSCLWEIVPLRSQFHPSVVHFAASVVNGKTIGYKGDPSQDFTLISFLDKFMYRNPKQKDVEHGSSLMQRTHVSVRRKEEPVNSKVFLQKSEEDVPCDQVFFHRYFKQQMMEKDVKKEEGKADLSDTDDVDDVDDIDFAGEMKKNSEINRKNKNKKDKEDADGSDSESAAEEEEDKEDAFDYDNMEDESSDEDEPIQKDNYNDKDFEKALFETLDSEGESIDGDEEENNAAPPGDKGDSMFADAQDFSHLIERDENDKVDGVHRKQIQWEEKQDAKQWRFKKNRGNMKRKMNTTHNHGKYTKKKAKK